MHVAADLQRQKRPYSRAAKHLTLFTGSPRAVLLVTGLLLAWVALGFGLDFPRWWELVVTIGMPFLTVLLLIVLQHTQNHDSQAMQLKLDELIRVIEPAEDGMISLEDADTGELAQVQHEFRRHASNS